MGGIDFTVATRTDLASGQLRMIYTAPMENLAWVLLAAIASGFGGYFGSYLNKKGENLATKEDFKDLKDQTAELARATKEIEAKIDDKVWNRQRQWELKKEIFIEATRSVAKADETLARTVSAYLNGYSIREGIDQCEKCWYELAYQASSIMFISDPATIDISSNLSKTFIDTVLSLKPDGDNRAEARQKFDQFRALRAAFYVATRNELGIVLGPLPTPQSSGSSAAQGPAA